MRRRVLLVATVVALMVGTPAAAQVSVPGEGIEPPGRTGRTERTPGTGRTEGTGRTPGTGRTEGTGRTPGTGRTEGSGRTPGTARPGTAGHGHAPHRLPVTGASATELALDGVTLLGAGALLLRMRRRLFA